MSSGSGKVGPGGRRRIGTEMRIVVSACAVYSGMVLLFTWISLYAAPPESQIGTFRPVAMIPSHEVVLVLFGLGLGLAISLVMRRLDFGLVILVPALVVLTDLDHLPSILGMAQPIRPAHSFIFILFTVALMAMVIRRTDVELASLSAFFAHLSVDTGVFPAFSPISFQYYDLGEFRAPFILAAVAFALCAGLAYRLNRRGGAK